MGHPYSQLDSHRFTLTVCCNGFFGWLTGKVFDLPPFFSVGLILVSSRPVGTASNFVFLSRSNLALSVTMTALSTLAAIVMTPLLISSLFGSEIDVNAMDMF